MLKTKLWIIIVGIAALSTLLSVFVLTEKRDGTVVEIVQDGNVIRRIDLAKVTEEESFIIEYSDDGSNTVTVQPGRICVSEADCPDKICVEQGWLSNQAAPIVCMPHRLIIRVVDDAATDAVSQ